MKLPARQLDIDQALAEFDVWITPSLGEVRDTDRFRKELDRVASVFDALCSATNDFADVGRCSPAVIADTFVGLADAKSDDDATELLRSLASVLFLVTGKSDNNLKCQLPLHLHDTAKWSSFPVVRTRRGRRIISFVGIPRTLKSDRYMATVVQLREHTDHQKRLLMEFVSFVLSDEAYVSQLWSVGRSYALLKALGKHRDLLTPLVVFQVRGSVSASGGHGPEAILREHLKEWGLIEGVDFNTTDVVVGNPNTRTRKKTRAYDFVLPYQTPFWAQRVFVQCQFYAGDSGSVSHKNVDQTSTSRQYVEEANSSATFVEYVDGAGYFSSLNGDLKNLLAMQNTTSFFQLRSAAIRLRREVQQIGFLIPIELEHAILRCGGARSAVISLLVGEGYDEWEVNRCMDSCLERHLVVDERGGRLSLLAERRVLARRYILLDIVAIGGDVPSQGQPSLVGSLLIPGYGPFYSMKIDDVAAEAVQVAPSLRDDWSSPEIILQDIRWLCEQGFAMSR